MASKSRSDLVKKYIILIVIFVVTGFLTLYCCKCYQVYNDYKKEIPVIRDTLSSEIMYNDLDHYIVENPNTIIYLCTSNDDNCRGFEKKFSKYVKKNEMNDVIVYLNLTGIDQESFVNEFNDKYKFKVKLTTKYPAFISFRDGEVVALLQGNENKSLTMVKVDNFLELNYLEDEE